MKEIISQLVDDDYVQSWLDINPDVYYRDGKPYGLMAEQIIGDYLYICCTVDKPENPFTYGMVKRIKKSYMKQKICLILDTPAYHKHLMDSFKRYKFRYEFNDDVIFAYGMNHD